MQQDLELCREIVIDILSEHFIYPSILALSGALVFECIHAFHVIPQDRVLRKSLRLCFQIRDYLTEISTQNLALEQEHIEEIAAAIVSVVRAHQHIQETDNVSSSPTRLPIAA